MSIELHPCCPDIAAGGEVNRKRFTRLPSMFFSAAPIDARLDLGIRHSVWLMWDRLQGGQAATRRDI